MSSDTLVNIKELLCKLQILTDSELTAICDLLRMYRIGMWLYPGVIVRRIPLTIDKTYAVVDTLAENNYIKPYYELYCNNCQKATGIVFETLGEMPQEFECEICHATMISIQNSILVYKVVVG